MAASSGIEPEIAFHPIADGYRAGIAVAFADDEHVGDQLHLGVADFGVELFTAVVAGDAEAGVAEQFFDFAAVFF